MIPEDEKMTQNAGLNFSANLVGTFKNTYERSSKSSGRKNLRCFPRCRGGVHNSGTFCGDVVEAQIMYHQRCPETSEIDVDFNKLVVLGEFTPVGSTTDLNSLSPGDLTSMKQMVEKIKHEEWLPSVVKEEATRFHTAGVSVTVVFNYLLERSWHYGRPSSRGYHTFKIFVLAPLRTTGGGTAYKCVGTYSDGPKFQMTHTPRGAEKNGEGTFPPPLRSQLPQQIPPTICSTDPAPLPPLKTKTGRALEECLTMVDEVMDLLLEEDVASPPVEAPEDDYDPSSASFSRYCVHSYYPQQQQPPTTITPSPAPSLIPTHPPVEAPDEDDYDPPSPFSHYYGHPPPQQQPPSTTITSSPAAAAAVGDAIPTSNFHVPVMSLDSTNASTSWGCDVGLYGDDRELGRGGGDDNSLACGGNEEHLLEETPIGWGCGAAGRGGHYEDGLMGRFRTESWGIEELEI